MPPQACHHGCDTSRALDPSRSSGATGATSKRHDRACPWRAACQRRERSRKAAWEATLRVRGREGARRAVAAGDRSEAEPGSTRPAERGTPKAPWSLQPRNLARKSTGFSPPPEIEFENGSDNPEIIGQ